MTHSSVPLLPMSLFVLGMLSSFFVDNVSAFTVKTSERNVASALVSQRSACMTIKGGSASSVSLQMAGNNNFFDDIGKFFERMGNNSDNDDAGEGTGEQYLGNARILSIPVESLKVGGLRLYISLYLMGQQNSPEKGSWRAHQSGDSGIDVYYRDQTGALLIELCEDTNRILVDRLGNQPSNAYIMQESVIIQGLLDELDVISQDEDIPLNDRLLVLKEPGDAIDVARESLAFS
mmetsp:Transcript_6510/g.14254  ORF Transcript_6510/g.14254 Transcript_6510/m.14254 type:complete len:234 (+) Transcript_6510:158-859(+)|eukprot:CAMPEP_0178518618 /NCGR_PEP_ID=MMETSP0696-20121128/26365_1 /TAXON_ID=265572 /ORGANISM="Extubocellulus spinifer, Strain CCMP396" /LENGTH=233 /DNA_ID=CAMNT_0020149217 /DNA_START=103 /DNA_END=804 /DNA_ORIENTATION=-